MAKIPNYGTQTETRTPFALTEDARVSVPNVGAAIGRGVEDVATVLQRRADEEGDLWVGTAAADAKTQWIDRLRKVRENAAPGAQYAQSTLREFDEWVPTALDNAPDRRSRRRLEATLTAFRGALASDALRAESEDTVAFKQGRLVEAINKNGALLVSKPEMFGQLYQDSADMIAGSGLPAKQREATLKATRRELAKSAVQGLIEQNPGGALTRLNRGEFDDYLDGTTKAALINRAQAEGRSRAVQGRQMLMLQRAEVGNEFRDMTAAITAGAVNMYSPTFKMPANLTIQNLKRLFGEERGQRMYLALTDASVAGAYKRELSTAAADDIPALIRRYQLPITADGARTDLAANRDMAAATVADLKARRAEMLAIVKSEVAQAFVSASRPGDPDIAGIDALANAGYRAQVSDKLKTLVGEDLAGAVMKKIDAAAAAGTITRDIREGVPKGDALAAINAAVDGLGDDKLQAKLTGIVQRTIAQREKGLREDPASYVSENSTAVRAARAAYAETLANPGATAEQKADAAQRFAQASLDAQAMMGVRAPHVLPTELAQRIVGELTRPGDGDKAQIVQGLAQTWGKHWPAIMGQLAQKGEGLPEMAALAMVPPGSGIARDLSAIMGVKTADLKKPLETNQTTGLDGYINKNLRDMQASVQFGQADPAYRALRESAYRLSLYYIGRGDGASAAADKATKFIADRYSFAVINGATTRLPKSAGDPRGMEWGIRTWIAGADGIDLPDDWQRLYPKTAEKEARAAYLSSFRSRAQPVTAEGDTGFYAMMNGRIVTRYGQPLFVDFRAVNAPDLSRLGHRLRGWVGEDGLHEFYLDPATGKEIEFIRPNTK